LETIDNVFKNIIEEINSKIKKNVKTRRHRKKEEVFSDYFKEAETLLPIQKEIQTLHDLIELGESYNPLAKERYVIHLKALHKCVDALKELNNMVGMKNIKQMIIDLFFFRLQDLEENVEGELWHLVIQGTPGSGKTEVARILGKLYYGLGIIKKNKFTAVKRSDMIGKYLGHTAKMTQEVFENARGGILFIDEAYSLGNAEGRDTFSKECIDTINQNLTECKDTVVFIAGYKEQLDECFFSCNPGLNRRFKMRLTVDSYHAKDLREIYLRKVKLSGWDIYEKKEEKEIPVSFFEKNRDSFKYNGGDMENLWLFTRICHARRIFGKDRSLRRCVTLEDLENAFKMYSQSDEFKNRESSRLKYIHDTMYS
jgi:SpoVK/Ycf46/Vps4 family AAA+-type ATPase